MLAHPLAIVGSIVGLITLIGMIIFLSRRHAQFSGYQEIASDVKVLATYLQAQVFRDAHDLVLTGNYRGIPAILRFSNAENTPGMSLEMRVPATCQLSLTPKRAVEERRRQKIDLHSRILEDRYIGRSSTPLELEMLLGEKKAVKALEQLGCSSQTFLQLSPGKIELSEMLIPAQLSIHVLDHVEAVHELSTVLASLPGSDVVKIAPIIHERSSWPFRATVAAGVVIAAISVLAATRDHAKPVAKPSADAASINGIVKSDADVIPLADQWRTAQAEDFDAGFTELLAGIGHQPSSRIEFSTDGSEQNKGVAYLLVNEKGVKRLVVLVNHHPIFDTGFPSIAGVALVSATSLQSAQAKQAPIAGDKSSGDAILMVRNVGDPQSAVLLFVQNGTLHSSVPQDYRQVQFE